jgi:hypothetical protein
MVMAMLVAQQRRIAVLEAKSVRTALPVNGAAVVQKE